MGRQGGLGDHMRLTTAPSLSQAPRGGPWTLPVSTEEGEVPGRGRPDAPAAQGRCSILAGNSIVCEDARLFTRLFQSDAFPCSASTHSAGEQTPTLDTLPNPPSRERLVSLSCSHTHPSPPEWEPLVQTCHPCFQSAFRSVFQAVEPTSAMCFSNGAHVCERPRAPLSAFTPQLPC